MQLFDSIEKIRTAILEKRQLGMTVGLVPTMGALHDGHLSLVKEARVCDLVIVSIFVNPLQFNNEADLTNYPRTLDNDLATLSDKCDMVFAPAHEVIFADSPTSTIDFGKLGNKLEGEFRPGHFSGVGLIIAKLLNIIQPDFAYFGLKDFQQFLLMKQLVHDFSFPVQVVGCPTIREQSGLALSSRNARLSTQGKRNAAKIFAGLNIVKDQFEGGVTLKKATKTALSFYENIPDLEIEYLEFISSKLELLDEFNNSEEMIVCVAAIVEGVRLIDNLYLR